tara:strand:- start:1097 stop:3706 length:2610 start_codon:yes stop_codon:yes gene_type:complete
MFLWFFILFSLSKSLLAETPPVILKDGHDHYELGFNLDILEDKTGKLNIKDVNNSKWSTKFKRSKNKVPNFGLNTSNFWARVRIQNKAKNQKTWVISQNIVLQQEVTFYKKVNGAWQTFYTGAQNPYNSRDIDDKTFSFKIKPKADAIYFFKIKGSASRFHLTISSPLYFSKNRTKENLFSGFFFGLVITVAVYNLFIFFTTKSLTYLFYVLYVFFYGMALFIMQGFSQRFLAPESIWIPNNGLFFFIGSATLFLSLFTISILRLKEQSKILYIGALFFAFTSFLICLSSFFSTHYFNLLFVELNAPLELLYLIFCGIYIARKKYRPAYYYLLAFFFMALGAIIYILMIGGAVPSNLITNQSLFIGNALELILLSLGVGDRFNIIQDEHLKLQKNYAKDLKIEVDEKTKSIKGLVENLGQGFMVMDKNGVIQEGATKITKDLFNHNPVGKSLPDLLGLDKEEVQNFNRWLKNIWKGHLSFNDLTALGPKFFESNQGRYIHLDYKPIYFEGSRKKVDKVICVATDKTQEMELEKRLESDKQNAAFINSCLQNPVEFVDLLDDTFSLLEIYPKIKESSTSELFRKFHTLKARFGQFGAKDLTHYINEIETGISKNVSKELDSKVQYFESQLQDFIKRNRLIIEAANKFLVDEGNAIEISDVIKKAKEYNESKDLINYLQENYLLNDIKKKFERYTYLVNELAEAQGKSIEMEIKGEEIKVDTNKYSNFINASIHLFRNMVDHGIETEDERIEKTKPRKGSIKVNFKIIENSFLITLIDDGAGIDPEKVRQIVAEKGLKSNQEISQLKPEDFINMIFLPGLSTKPDITEVSGRGVGMDAVKEEVEKLNGEISVTSKVDEGTMFTVKLPMLIK